MIKRHRQPHGPTSRAALPRGKQKEAGVGLTPKNSAPQPTTRSKRLVELKANYNTPYQNLNGWAPTRGPRGRGIGAEVAFTTRQSAGRSGALDTGRHAFGGLGNWRGGGGSGVRVRVGGEGGCERPRRGADRMFSFSFVLFSLADWGEGDWGALLGSSISIWDWIWIFSEARRRHGPSGRM